MNENRKKISRLVLFWVIVILIGLVLDFFWWSQFSWVRTNDGLFGTRNLLSALWMPLASNKFLNVMLLIFWSPFLQVLLFCLIRKLLIGKRKMGQIIRWAVIYEVIVSSYTQVGILLLIFWSYFPGI